EGNRHTFGLAHGKRVGYWRTCRVALQAFRTSANRCICIYCPVQIILKGVEFCEKSARCKQVAELLLLGLQVFLGMCVWSYYAGNTLCDLDLVVVHGVNSTGISRKQAYHANA